MCCVDFNKSIVSRCAKNYKEYNNSDNNKTTKIKKDGINIDYFYNISLGSDEVEDD